MTPPSAGLAFLKKILQGRRAPRLSLAVTGYLILELPRVFGEGKVGKNCLKKMYNIFIYMYIFIYILYIYIYSGWWFQPIWKICSSNWTSFPNRGDNKNYLKPPPSIYIHIYTRELACIHKMILWKTTTNKKHILGENSLQDPLVSWEMTWHHLFQMVTCLPGNSTIVTFLGWLPSRSLR